VIMEKFLPKKIEKDVISMRIPRDVLEILDQKAYDAGISRNELINQCINFALTHMNSDGDDIN